MNYDEIFDKAIDRLHAEGRYRVFADLERRNGAFPRAMRHGAKMNVGEGGDAEQNLDSTDVGVSDCGSWPGVRGEELNASRAKV